MQQDPMSRKFSRITLRIGCSIWLAAAAFLATGCATTTDPLGDRAVPTRMQVARLADVGARADTAAAKQHFIRGMGYEARDQYDQAVAEYRKAMALLPDEPAILMATAEALLELEDLEGARYYARQAHEADPADARYHELYADLLLNTGDGPGAIAAYTDLVERHPNAIEARFDLARVQTHLGRLREALATYQGILEILGEDVEVRTEILHLYIRLADSDGIISTLESMVEAEPYNTSFIRMLAEAHAQNENPERAISLLQRAIDLEPDDFSLVIKLADLFRELGRDAEADAVYAEASSQNQSVDALLAQASAFYARAAVDDDSESTAERLLNRVLELDPENPDAALMLGSIRFQDGRYAEAAPHFETALTKHRGQMQVWFQAAAAYLQGGNSKEAARMADEALTLFPDQPDLLRVAAYAYMEQFDNELALGRFQTLLHVLEQDHPDQPTLQADVFSSLAMVYDRQHNTAAADSLYLRAIEVDPDHSLSLNNYAYSLAERNEKLDEALSLALRAVELEPDNPSFLDTLGWIYFQLQDYEKAREFIG
ncbi:MAG TPA: tetratricopeptide repeat protein, partial [Rhodothermales bacterium]